MVSPTLHLRIIGGHSVDNKLSSSCLPAKSSETSSSSFKIHHAYSADGKWQGIKQGDPACNKLTEGRESARATGHSSWGEQDSGSLGLSSMNFHGPTSSDGGVASEVSASSDWNVISSGSFDETYLECAYSDSNGGVTSDVASAASVNHFDEPIYRHVLENADHEMPLFSPSYPGTSWFLSGKAMPTNANGCILPTMEELTPRSQAFSAPTFENATGITVSASAPSFQPDVSVYPTFAEKRSNECPADVPSPVQMENFVPCVPYTLEQPELLFEDMHSWTGASVGVYNQQHDHEHHDQSFSGTSPSHPIGSHIFDNTNVNITSAGFRELTPQYQTSQLHTAATPNYRLAQNHGGTVNTGASWSAESNHQYFMPPVTTTMSTATTELPPSATFANHVKVAAQPFNTSGPLNGIPPLHELEHPPKRILRSSTLSQRASSNGFQSTGVLPKVVTPNSSKPPSLSSSSSYQSAKIQLLTALNDCYWKNGRKNLQCFPTCPEHNDFYSMKMNNRKHSSVGVCRGPVYCHAVTDAAEFFPASTSQLEMEQLAKASKSNSNSNSNSNAVSELFVLGRFERVPQQESTNLLEELHAPPSFQTAAAFEQFRYNCFQAVEMEERRALLSGDELKPGMAQSNADTKPLMRSTWFFLPDVWKVQPMLKKKRKATRSAPAQTFPFCFRVFIYKREEKGTGFHCIADAASSFFELYSTRTVDRVKRKYWGGESPASDSKKRATKRR